jgi:hypothetical protein
VDETTLPCHGDDDKQVVAFLNIALVEVRESCVGLDRTLNRDGIPGPMVIARNVQVMMISTVCHRKNSSLLSIQSPLFARSRHTSTLELFD